MSELQDLQIAFNWAKTDLDRANGSKFSNPDSYEKVLERYNKIRKKFGEAVIEFIDYEDEEYDDEEFEDGEDDEEEGIDNKLKDLLNI
jgi:hypothetical protein